MSYILYITYLVKKYILISIFFVNYSCCDIFLVIILQKMTLWDIYI